MGLHKVGDSHKLQESSEEHIRAYGLFVLFVLDALYLVVGFFYNLNFHSGSLSFGDFSASAFLGVAAHLLRRRLGACETSLLYFNILRCIFQGFCKLWLIYVNKLSHNSNLLANWSI